MPSGPYFDGVETSITEHAAEAFGVIPARPEAQYAEEMTDSPIRARSEIDSRHAPTRSEYAADLGQPSTFQFVRQMVEHHAAQHHIEVVARVRQRLNHADLETYLDAGPGGVSTREFNHLRGGVDATDFRCRSGHPGGDDSQSAGAAAYVEHPLTGSDPSELNDPPMQSREPTKRKDRRAEVVETCPVNGPAFGVRSSVLRHATRRGLGLRRPVNIRIRGR
jgi:hypothetical protein